MSVLIRHCLAQQARSFPHLFLRHALPIVTHSPYATAKKETTKKSATASTKENATVKPKKTRAEKTSTSSTTSTTPQGQPLYHIPKLDDAYEAGGPNAHKCTLILTEGDSAKALVVAGLSELGRDYYGIFPLRGKFLNVRETNMTQVAQNAEVQALLEIVGLTLDNNNSPKKLRYGRIMIMTDQDHDGSHIKGLLLNFLDYFWPQLTATPGFLEEFITPLIKVRRRNEERVFFTLPEFEAWRQSHPGGHAEEDKGTSNPTSSWTVKYYKGLGTSTSAEARQYFAAMTDHRVPFLPATTTDRQALDLVFNRRRAEDRKAWLLNDYTASLHVNHIQARLEGGLSLSEFIAKELIHFSMADNVRSIPSVMDGLKPSQRKVLFACLRKNLRTEMKVAQLAGYVAQVSAYHHGEQSLAGTIVHMAQDYVGSNNIPLLEPQGQFGTRLQNGKDAASPRYIYTHLSPLTLALFPRDDEPLLNALYEDGQPIEPEHYVPILPLILVNGTDGIGTGWSTFVPNYAPRDIVANLKRRMHGLPWQPMTPWYRGFTGTLTAVPPQESGELQYVVHGVCRALSETVLEITELPLRRWSIETYKAFLQGLCRSLKGEQTLEEFLIEGFQESHTDTRVHFRVTLTATMMQLAQSRGLLKTLKLEGHVSTGNMTLFSPERAIVRYASTEAVMEAFYGVRLRCYERRKALLLQRLQEECARSTLRRRFLEGVVRGEIAVMGVSRSEAVENTLRVLGDSAQSLVESLLALPIHSLLKEKLQAMASEVGEKEAAMALLQSKSPTDLWHEDLDYFLKLYEKKFEKKE